MQPLKDALTPFAGLFRKLPSEARRLACDIDCGMGLGIATDKWPADDFDCKSQIAYYPKYSTLQKGRPGIPGDQRETGRSF